MAARSAAQTAVLLFALAAACAGPGYAPYPLQVGALPEGAFAGCRDLLLREFGALDESDAEAFRLQTAWAPLRDPPGERRASVYRDGARPSELSVVVELRWLRVPVLGMPHWTTPRGDDAAERALAERLREVIDALRPPAAERTAAR